MALGALANCTPTHGATDAPRQDANGVRITVVIPCFNAQAFVGEAVASAKAQSRPPEEILVVDDGSSDDSAACAVEAGATVIRGEGNAGPAASRNLGWQTGLGEVVAFLDADDRWLPEHLEVTTALLERFHDAGVAFSGFREFGERGRIVAAPITPNIPVDLSEHIWATNPILQSSAVVRRSLLQAVGGYDESWRHAEDFELWLRLSLTTRFVATDRITALYRVHAGQVTAIPAPMYAGAWRARAKHFKRVQPTLTPERQHALEGSLVQIWERDLAEAWRQRSHSTFPAVLALEPLVPGSMAAAQRWRRRALLRPAWRGAAWLYDHAPAWLRMARRRRAEPGVKASG